MKEKDFVTYEYTVRTVKAKDRARAADVYEAFGWEITDTRNSVAGNTTLSLKRARDIRHRQELIRLERQAEEAVAEIDALERSKTFNANIFAILFGCIAALILGGGMSMVMLGSGGVAVMVCGSLIGIAGITLCCMNYPIYKKIAEKKNAEVTPLVCDSEERLANILEKGNSLISAENI